MTEEEILKELDVVNKAKTDPEHFGVLYDRYFEQIFQFILRRTDDEQLTADLVSQSFFKALQYLPKYEFRGVPFSAWIYRIASNEVNKYYTRKKRNRVFSLEEERLMDIIDRNEITVDEDQMAKMIQLLNEQPTEIIEILELRFFEDRSFKEISYILGIGESGAKMRLYRALEKLKKQLIAKTS